MVSLREEGRDLSTSVMLGFGDSETFLSLSLPIIDHDISHFDLEVGVSAICRNGPPPLHFLPSSHGFVHRTGISYVLCRPISVISTLVFLTLRYPQI